MHWFESSKDKEFRQLIQGKMEICLTKPDKYESAFLVLESQVRKPSQKAIQMMVDHIKQVIKDDDVPPPQKVQAIKLLRDLMQSHSKPLGKYVVKKILKRLTILAQHRKNQKTQDRGANIFKCKKSQQKYGIQFLRILLLSLSDWGNNWPRNADGPYHDFHSAYKQLLLEQITFPPEQRKANKSPIPKPAYRNSRGEQVPSPPKLSSDNKTKIQNPITKQVIKQRKPLGKQQMQYINSMIQMLNVICDILVQNKQFNQMWAIIKQYVQQLRKLDQEGNFLLLKMNQSGQQNREFATAVTNNSNLIASITKDVSLVNRKNQNYTIFNQKYTTNCKRLIISLSVFNDKPSSNNNSLGTVNVRQAQTSLNQKVQQLKPKPLAQENRNRYGSSAQLRNQLQINLQQIRKEDFNSGNLNRQNQNSQGESSRHDSKSPNLNEKNRNSLSQFNNSKQNKKKESQEDSQQIQITQKPSQEKEKNNRGIPKKESFQSNKQRPVKKLQPKQISKITQKNQNQSQNNFSKFQKSQVKNNKNDASFGQFQIPAKPQIDSNSNFFNQMQNRQQLKMQTGMRRNRKVQNNKNQQISNFFDASVKSKVSQHFSGFEKSKSKSNQQQNDKSNNQSSKQVKPQQKSFDFNADTSKAFDTFKSPNQIAKGMQQINKQNGSARSAKSKDSQVSNPFKENINIFEKGEDFFGQNSFNKSVSNIDNPFQTRQPTNNQRNQQQDDNPFATQIKNDSRASKKISGQYKNEERNDNSSVSSNPFSQKGDNNSVKSKQSVPAKNRQKTNPFDTISQKSKVQPKFQNPFQQRTEKDDNPFGTSFISNPFDKTEKKAENSFEFQKPLSQRGSFVNAENAQNLSMKNKSSILNNPFENPPQFVNSDSKLFEKKPSNNSKQLQPKNQKISIESKKSGQQRKSNEQNKFPEFQQPKKQENDGFGFDDFMNMSQNRSSTGSNKQANKQKQQNQSGFNFSDFKNSQHDQNSKNQFFENNFFEQSKKSLQKNISKNVIEQKSKESSFDFFQTSNMKKQKPAQKDNFFQAAQKSVENIKKIEQPSKSSEGMKFQFDDFPNAFSKSNSQLQKSLSNKNQFSQFQKSKQQSSGNPFSLPKQQQKLQQIKEKKEQNNHIWDDFKKPSSDSSDQWNKFANFNEKDFKKDQINKNDAQSQYQQSQKSNRSKQKQINEWFNQQNKMIESKPKSKKEQPPRFGNQQKSISIQFEEPSPFQKKQIPWQFTLAALPSSTRYNITSQHIYNKKQILDNLKEANSLHCEKFNEMNEVLRELKKKYSENLNRLGQAKQQKRQFSIILKRFFQTNEIKSKQIEQLIKKKRKAEQIKRKILQNQRILYERLKSDKHIKQGSLIGKEKTGNKFQRFNQNLQRQRQMFQPQKNINQYSYYA